MAWPLKFIYYICIRQAILDDVEIRVKQMDRELIGGHEQLIENNYPI